MRGCVWSEVRHRTATALMVLPVLGLACAATAPSTIEQRPDGTFKLTCQNPLPQCLQKAEETCQGTRYVVLRAADHHDYLGGASGIGEVQVRSSEAIVRCGRRGKSYWGADADPMGALESSPTFPAAGPSERTAAGGRSCVPGVTQKCIGRAACRGGQFCLPDGSGYAPCDCGDGLAPAGLPGDAGAPPSSAGAKALQGASAAAPGAPAPPPVPGTSVTAPPIGQTPTTSTPPANTGAAPAPRR